MARHTFFGCGLVEKHSFSSDELRQLMALCAAYILVCPAQRKICPAVMIEERGPPLHAVVAVSAVRHLPRGKLFPVDVLMALFTLRWRSLEIYIDQLGFEVGWLVAVHASRRPVRSDQRKCGLRVIESG